jgi:UDP-galactopyranose mutase
MISQYDIIIAGAGLSGSVIAHLYATKLNKKVLVIDKRNHIGGNCYDYIDKKSGILVNKYGAHIFHTNDTEVWNFVNKFSEWERWDHQVIAETDDLKLVPLPVNINTINKIMNESLQNDSDMIQWLDKNKIQIDNINNAEDYALSKFGSIIYDKLFKYYTMKQWNTPVTNLDKSVLERIPIRYNFDNRYFSDKYQALPKNGYTSFFKNLLNHPNITIKLKCNFFDINIPTDKIIIFTGPIDNYYSSIGYEPLKYRSIQFVKKIYKTRDYILPNSVINFTHNHTGFTRAIEYKHFLNQSSTHSVVVFEKPTDKGEPMYPIPNKENQDLYEKYKELSKNDKNIHFIGRLANYKYFNMDQAIRNAIDYFNENLINL